MEMARQNGFSQNSMKNKTPLVFHPFLLAVYPVLALLAFNISQVSVNTAVRSLILMLAGAALLFGVLSLLLRDRIRAGLVTTLWLVLFSSYGHVYQALTGIKIGNFILRRHSYLLPIWLLMGGVLTVLILRRAAKADNLTRALNIAGAAAVLMAAFQIGTYFLRPGGGSDLSPAAKAPQVKVQALQGETRPDVYYIILDMYTRQDLLQDAFHFDNSAFIDQLEALGFYVATCSRSNYRSTELSISSSLNMDYYQNLIGGTSNPNLAGWIRQSAVRKAFESAGYTSIAFDSGYSPTSVTEADQYYGSDQSVLNVITYRGANAFEGMLLKSSMGILIYDYSTKLGLKPQMLLDGAFISHRERIQYTLSMLPELATQPAPKFVFAHILAPHEPFVFDRDGNFASRDQPFTLNGDMEYTTNAYAEGYAGQITYLNNRILSIVQQIIANSDTPPVIILQGDHGSHRTGLEAGDTPILNAYYLPGDAAGALYPTISPVNSFRVVFNAYLDAKMPLLPDESYLSEYVSPYHFIQSIDPEPGCRQ
jgi:hypothetical protein